MTVIFNFLNLFRFSPTTVMEANGYDKDLNGVCERMGHTTGHCYLSQHHGSMHKEARKKYVTSPWQEK